MPLKKNKLTIKLLLEEAGLFSKIESKHAEPLIYGTTDGKAVGTYIEQKFRRYLLDKYNFVEGNSAKGIDFPEVNIDVKTTSISQPQSSSPFRSARQKIFGLGYSLVLFVYDKKDNPKNRTANLNFLHTVFVDEKKTADFQMTRGLLQILDNHGNKDDLVAFMMERNLPIDEIEAGNIAEELLQKRPEQGYLTVSNALQWRLQYGRVIQLANKVDGITNLI